MQMPTTKAMDQPRVLDDDAGLIRTRVQWVARLGHPLHTPPWGIEAISIDEVRGYVPAGECAHAEPPQDQPHDPWLRTPCRSCDVATIARYTTHGWPPAQHDPHPVFVDVGLGSFIPQWPTLDGNHRVAAALVRGDEFIDVVVGGDWARAIAVLIEGADLYGLN